MENISLTSEEKKELEKRGFIVIKNYRFLETIKDLLLAFIYLVLGIALAIGMVFYLGVFLLGIAKSVLGIFGLLKYCEDFMNHSVGWLALGIVIFMEFIPILRYYYAFLFSGKTFVTENGIVSFGRVNESSSLFYKYLGAFDRYISRFSINLGWNYLHVGFLGLFFYIALIGLSIAWEDSTIGIIIPEFVFSSIYSIIFTPIFFFVLLALILNALRILFQSFHPLYAFGNIGMKIQGLTPEIEKQSQLIQTEFQKDMNFSVLHVEFEKLSSTFSRIVELVLKLEKIEARANKGNLFDSAKYIGSLRADIVTPLVELRKFLESQREQLVESQKELSRVRVGGDGSLEGNAELQSKRSELLLQELDTNIGKLGEMITKLS